MSNPNKNAGNNVGTSPTTENESHEASLAGPGQISGNKEDVFVFQGPRKPTNPLKQLVVEDRLFLEKEEESTNWNKFCNSKKNIILAVRERLSRVMAQVRQLQK